MILKVSENKEQLIHFIFNDLMANRFPQDSLRFSQKLTVTRKDPIPLQIFTGHPAGNTYEKLKDNLTLSWFITYDGTNIFVLLLHFTFTGEIKSEIYMKLTNKESSTHVIDIAETYEGHIKIMPNIFPAHDLSNTVCLYFDTGNKYWMV